MPVNSTSICDLILQECGDVFGDTNYPDGIITPQIEVIWASYDDKARIPRLQELYAKLRCLYMLWGYFKNQVSFEVPLELKWNARDRGKAVENMIGIVQGQVTALEEKYARVFSAYVGGPITKTAPRRPPLRDPLMLPLDFFQHIDANMPSLAGDPYYDAPGRIP